MVDSLHKKNGRYFAQKKMVGSAHTVVDGAHKNNMVDISHKTKWFTQNKIVDSGHKTKWSIVHTK